MRHDYDWQGAGTRLPDGHRIFQGFTRAGEVEWGIADDSGRTPDQTDDGVLWLDQERCLMVMAPGVEGESEHLAIPLIDEQGKKSRTPTDAATVLELSRQFHWTIHVEAQGRFYNVQ